MAKTLPKAGVVDDRWRPPNERPIAHRAAVEYLNLCKHRPSMAHYHLAPIIAAACREYGGDAKKMIERLKDQCEGLSFMASSAGMRRKTMPRYADLRAELASEKKGNETIMVFVGGLKDDVRRLTAVCQKVHGHICTAQVQNNNPILLNDAETMLAEALEPTGDKSL